MGAVTIQRGGNTVVTLKRDTVAKIQALPRQVTARAGSSAQVVERANTVQPIVQQPNVLIGKSGLQGPKGQDGDLHYRHVQSTPSTTWTVTHNLGKHPTLAVTDSGGSVVIGDVFYQDTNTCVVTFSSAFSGEAHCN